MYNVLDYLQASANAFPDKIAFADKDKQITYDELIQRSKQIGSALANRFQPRTPIPVFMEKSVDTIALFFGIVYAGCFYVMLDVLQPKQRLMHILDTLQTRALISSQDYASDLKQLQMENHAIMLEQLVHQHIDEELLRKIKEQALDIDPLYGIFTSGSTGVPKGVVVAHRSVIDFIDVFTETFHITHEEIIGNQAPWDFDVSVKDIYTTIKVGATMQIIPKQYFSMPSRLLDFLCNRGVTTIIWAVSAMCIISTLKGFEYKVPEKIKNIMFSGEVMPIKQLNIWRRYLPNANYVNLYGPTEITCNCTYHIIQETYEIGDVIPIGKAFQNKHVFLLDEKDQEITQSGRKGEICVAGTAVTLGYYHNDEQTRKAFCRNPLRPDYLEWMYRTGDIGYYDQKGRLFFSSRKDFQIKHMGHRIELGEIEAKLERIDAIQRACCLYINHRIVAFYQGDMDRKSLTRALKETLPIFMIPNVFLSLERFPITKNGKINREALTRRMEKQGYANA